MGLRLAFLHFSDFGLAEEKLNVIVEKRLVLGDISVIRFFFIFTYESFIILTPPLSKMRR